MPLAIEIGDTLPGGCNPVSTIPFQMLHLDGDNSLAQATAISTQASEIVKWSLPRASRKADYISFFQQNTLPVCDADLFCRTGYPLTVRFSGGVPVVAGKARIFFHVTQTGGGGGDYTKDVEVPWDFIATPTLTLDGEGGVLIGSFDPCGRRFTAFVTLNYLGGPPTSPTISAHLQITRSDGVLMTVDDSGTGGAGGQIIFPAFQCNTGFPVVVQGASMIAGGGI